MKKKFTFLIAAIAMMAILVPMKGWGQIEVTFTPGTDTGATSVTKDGITATMTTMNISSYYQIYANQSGTFSVTGTDKITKIEFTCTATGTNKYGPGNASASVGNYSYSGNTGTWTGEESEIIISSTAQVRMTLLKITHIGSGSTPTTYTVTFDAGEGTFVGNTDFPNISNTKEAGTYTLPSATREGYTFEHWNIGQYTYDAGANYTVNANADFVASYTENTPPTPGGDLVIDFESAANTYTDWAFTNMTSQQTGSITAHGGTNYGTTGGKATASITTNTAIATPGTLTCYVSKQSTNTTSSTWYIQVSSDGTTWTDVESRSATDMNKGEWKEFAADLSSYNDVYVRVYYSGSTAIRNIDDLTLTTTVSSVATPTFTPADGTTFGNEGLSVTIACETPNTSIYYTVDGSTPDNCSTLYDNAISLTTTATIKAIAYDGTNYSNVATATYTYIDPNAPGTQNNPYTVAQARAAIDAGTGTQGVYATGIVSEIVEAYSPEYHNISYNISSDGTTTSDQLECFRGKSYDGNNFTSADDIQVGATVVVYGNLTKYGDTYEFAANNQLVSYTAPVVTTPTITVSPAALSTFTYEVDNGPSVAQTLTVSGVNLTQNISINITGDFEQSINGTDYSNGEITLQPDNGTVTQRTVSIRLAADLSVGNSYAGTITLTSDGASTVEITLAGTVTAPQAPHVTWDLSIASYDEITDSDIVTWSSNYATMTNSSKSGGTSASNYLGGDSNNRTSSRFYNGNTLTLSPVSGYSITSVVFTATGDGYASTLAGSTWTNATASASGAIVTVTPTNGASDMVATITGTCGFTAVTVYYETVDPVAPVWSQLPTPTVNVGEDYSITLSDYVSGVPAPTITPTSAVDGNNTAIASGLYDYDNGLLMFQPDAAGTFTFAFAATNTAGTANASLVITAVVPTPAITVNTTTINAPAALTGGEIEVTYTAIETSVGVEIIWCDANGDELQDQNAYASWLTADFATNDINTIEYIVGANDGAARTGYFKVYGVDGNASDVYSELVTITQEAYVAPVAGTWVLTTLAELTPADVFVIVGDNGDTYAMSNDNGTSAPAAVAVTVSNNTLSNPADNIQWNLVITDGGYIFYPAGDPENWLYLTNDNNGVKVGTGAAMHFHQSDGYLTTTETNDQRYIGIYNSQDWRCYKKSNGVLPNNIANQTFSFYKKVSDDVTYTKENIAAYDPDATPANGYVLIASPVASVTPSNNNGFLTNGYDLYYFDESQDMEWRNYKTTNFNLVSGKGYLYATNTQTNLTFTGQPYNGNGIVVLKKTDGTTFSGYNLIGNPFAQWASLNTSYYRMNELGNGFIAGTGNVAAMEGVFVQATSDGEMVTFTKANAANSSNTTNNSLNVNLSQVVTTRGERQNGVIDRAIVRFDEGNTLEKFMLNPENTKLYIPQDGKDYAVVNAQTQGEMPVSFKAAADGTYTISVETENLEASYLHLIDNMTGNDIDLLQTPSYSFDAKTTDYSSRFRLVFSANNVNSIDADETFAFISDGNIVISGTDSYNAVEVIDMMGRVIASCGNGTRTLSTESMAQGVYVIRIIGETTRTQKIVVK